LNESFFASRGFTLAAAAIGLVAVSALIFFVFRSIFGRRLRLPRNGRTRPVRLGIVDAFDLDTQRQLVIVRRDNVEHLLMIGGLNDLVIESQFIRSESRESRGYREAKFRDKELREMPPFPPSSSPAEEDLPLSARHKVATPPIAAAELEVLPSEWLDRAEQKSDLVLRPDARQTKDLQQDDGARGSHLPGAEPPRVQAPALVLPTTARFPLSPIPARRAPLDSVAGQKAPAQRDSARESAGSLKQHESAISAVARAPRASVTTPFLRPLAPRQAQGTGVQSPSRAPESRPHDSTTFVGPSRGPEAFERLHNADAAAAAPVVLPARRDAPASDSNGLVAVTLGNEMPQRADSFELEMARVLGREPESKA
jgi:flagellar protein FliO/FliZ